MLLNLSNGTKSAAPVTVKIVASKYPEPIPMINGIIFNIFIDSVTKVVLNGGRCDKLFKDIFN